MTGRCVVNVDLADLFAEKNRKGYLRSLAWGDQVEVLDETSTHLHVATVKFIEHKDGSITPTKTEAYICPAKATGVKPADVVKPLPANRVLKVNFVDVQQGDGSVIETPDGKVILVDGGDNPMFARYLAARFRGTSAQKPQQIDCIIVTHGDADHFCGLTAIHDSETHREAKKRLFISPERVYHNGIVKRPSKDKNGKVIPDRSLLGRTREVDGTTLIVGLVDDLLAVPDVEMNLPFRNWKRALAAWDSRKRITFRRLSFGDNDAFDFFNDGDANISVLGPILTKKNGATGLKFLGTPKKGPRIDHESLSLDEVDFDGLDAAHTINGHSIVFSLRYGGFTFLFTGDLNDEASRILARKHDSGEVDLRADVFKVPHHGSGDYSGAFISMVSPIISVVSSGDESAKKEFIHPRATLVGALGRHSSVDEPLVFVTELVAFFSVEGMARLVDVKRKKARGSFFAFSRAAYGMVKTRTDGKRLLVYTDSGKANLKEAYCYELDAEKKPVPARVVKV
jgi:beta-lactamase superfamily II metal-dependent hydrolase